MVEPTRANGTYIFRGLILISRLKKEKIKDGVGIMFWEDGTKYEG